MIKEDLNGGTKYDHGVFCKKVWKEAEEAFFTSNTSYAVRPTGDSLTVVKKIVEKYATHSLQNYQVKPNTDYNGYDLLRIFGI